MSVWHKKRKQDPAEINTEFKHVQGDATWKSYYLHPRYYPRQCAFKTTEEEEEAPSKRLGFSFFNAYFKELFDMHTINCVAQFLITLEHSSKKFTVVRSSYLFFIRHSFGVV